MTRAASASPEPHDRFQGWLRAGAPGDPPRDVAVHAVHCAACRRSIAALDRLLLVDTGRAPAPPSRLPVPHAGLSVRHARALTAAAAGMLVMASLAWIGVRALGPGATGGALATATPDQEVLGGIGTGSTPAPSTPGSMSEAPSASEADGATADPASTSSVAGATQPVAVPTVNPPFIPPATPPAATITAGPTRSADATARPSRTASPSAAVTPPPTASPSPPTPSPTAEPTPTPDASASLSSGPG